MDYFVDELKSSNFINKLQFLTNICIEKQNFSLYAINFPLDPKVILPVNNITLFMVEI